jgi:hypothetical protein
MSRRSVRRPFEAAIPKPNRLNHRGRRNKGSDSVVAGQPARANRNRTNHNSVKHANGNATVRTEKVALDTYSLSVLHDGPGLPARFEATKSQGLGMKLILQFVKQIGADLQIIPRHGGHKTCFTVTFASRQNPTAFVLSGNFNAIPPANDDGFSISASGSEQILAAITNPVSTIFCETIDRKGAPARQRDVRCSGHDAAKDINR